MSNNARLLAAYDKQLRTDAETPSAVKVIRHGPLRLVTFVNGRGFVTYHASGCRRQPTFVAISNAMCEPRPAPTEAPFTTPTAALQLKALPEPEASGPSMRGRILVARSFPGTSGLSLAGLPVPKAPWIHDR